MKLEDGDADENSPGAYAHSVQYMMKSEFILQHDLQFRNASPLEADVTPVPRQRDREAALAHDTDTPSHDASSASGRRSPLRVGVMLDELKAPAWIVRILAELKKSDFAEISLIVLRAPVGRPQPGLAGRLLKAALSEDNAGPALYYRYIEQDYRLHPQFLTPFRPRSLDRLLCGVPQICVHSIRTRQVDRFRKEDVQSIRDFRLDVLLRFGFNIPKGEILNSARYGIWSYQHSNSLSYRGSPALFWEMYENNPVFETILQKLADDRDGDRILYKSYSATESNVWLSQNREKAYWKSVAFAIRCLRQIYQHGESGLQLEAWPADRRPHHRTLTNYRMLPFFGRAAFTILKNKLTYLFLKEQWFIAYRRTRQSDGIVPDTEGFIPIIPPKDRIYADPFPFRFDGKDYVFFESLEYSIPRGTIACMNFDEHGNPGAIRNALSCDHHLSYPFLFEWNNAVYMLTEAAESKAVTLYRAVSFPDKWEPAAVLLDHVNAVDATLLEHEGRWYLFTNISEYGGSTNDELFIFHSDTPLGPWHAHPSNPIKSDARSARPAGRVFRKDGKLIRPSQDCTVTYGRSINFCEILTLTPTAYEERIAGSIQPCWKKGLIGTHTYNRTDTLECIDGKRLIWK